MYQNILGKKKNEKKNDKAKFYSNRILSLHVGIYIFNNIDNVKYKRTDALSLWHQQ